MGEQEEREELEAEKKGKQNKIKKRGGGNKECDYSLRILQTSHTSTKHTHTSCHQSNAKWCRPIDDNIGQCGMIQWLLTLPQTRFAH